MGYAAVIANIMSILDCFFDDTTTDDTITYLALSDGKTGTATVPGLAVGVHVSKGKEKTQEGELTTACGKQTTELGQLKGGKYKVCRLRVDV